MRTAELDFVRPNDLQATAPPERRGAGRDDVRLMVSRTEGRAVVPFRAFGDQLREGDLVVVNRSAAIPASLPAVATFGEFRLNLSTDYGHGTWLAEPRWSPGSPGPLPLRDGDRFVAGGLAATFLAPYPGLVRLGFVHLEGDVAAAVGRTGAPIRYGYVAEAFPIEAYRAVYADRPGSAEMPSAGRPFTPGQLAGLGSGGIRLAPVTLHAGVSSVEIDVDEVAAFPLYPEPYEVPRETTDAIAATRRRGGRVVAVGTTVVRALESAVVGDRVVPTRGFTRRFVRPEQPPRVVDGLLTGLHDPRTSHLAMLAAFAGVGRLRADYARAVEERMLWHEFGDSHLVWRAASAA